MKLKKLTTTALISLSVLMLGALYLEVLWLDWIVNSIFGNDVNRWLLALILTGVGVLTPRKLASLPLIAFFLSTCYIWIAL